MSAGSALLAAATLVLAACGSSSDAGSSTTSGGNATSGSGGSGASGEPIVVQTETNLTGQSTPYPAFEQTAKAYEKYINEKGGINGRPLQVIICDNKGDAANGAVCARQAADANVVSSVGSYNGDASREIPIYEEEQIAWFGAPSAVSQIENSSKISFPFNFISGATTAVAIQMAADGCERPADFYLDYPFADAFHEAFANGWKAAGKTTEIMTVKSPAAATEYSAQAGQLATFNPDCLEGGIVGETNWPSLITSLQGVGLAPRLYGNQGNLAGKVADQFPEDTNGARFVGAYPDLSAPQMAEYRAALEAYGADTSIDYNSLAGLGTWTAYVAFTNVVESMTGEINNVTFLEAASKTTALDTGGILPTMNLSEEWTGGGGAYPRAFNRFMQVGTIKDGKVSADEKIEPIDISNAFDGNPS